jgi:REP element-mobilizing transposase RayT
MAIGDHIVFCAYAFWLPNEPKGSRSDFIRAWELLRAGRATFTSSRRSVAHDPVDWPEGVEPQTKYPPVIFNGHQALAIVEGFSKAVDESGYQVYACSILPEHIHMVVARHRNKPKQIAGHLKARATQSLAKNNLHPLARFIKDEAIPTPWARGSWDVFLDTPADVRASIQYTENNPIKEGKRPQHWPFVRPFRSTR